MPSFEEKAREKVKEQTFCEHYKIQCLPTRSDVRCWKCLGLYEDVNDIPPGEVCP